MVQPNIADKLDVKGPTKIWLDVHHKGLHGDAVAEVFSGNNGSTMYKIYFRPDGDGGIQVLSPVRFDDVQHVEGGPPVVRELMRGYSEIISPSHEDYSSYQKGLKDTGLIAQ